MIKKDIHDAEKSDKVLKGKAPSPLAIAYLIAIGSSHIHSIVEQAVLDAAFGKCLPICRTCTATTIDDYSKEIIHFPFNLLAYPAYRFRLPVSLKLIIIHIGVACIKHADAHEFCSLDFGELLIMHDNACGRMLGRRSFVLSQKLIYFFPDVLVRIGDKEVFEKTGDGCR